MKKSLLIVAALILLVGGLFIGCAPAVTVDFLGGEWQCNLEGSALGITVQNEYALEFNNDNTYVFNESYGAEGVLTDSYVTNGDWKYEKNILTLTPDDGSGPYTFEVTTYSFQDDHILLNDQDGMLEDIEGNSGGEFDFFKQ